MLIQELVNAHVATTYANLNLILENTHVDPLRAKVIDTFVIAHEHDFELLSIWVVIDEFCDALVNRVSLDWYVDSNFGFQFDNVILEDIVFHFKFSNSLKKVQTYLVCVQGSLF